jgi:hypothetical protein
MASKRTMPARALDLFAMSNMRSAETGAEGGVIWVSAGEFASADRRYGPRIMVVLGDNIASDGLKDGLRATNRAARSIGRAAERHREAGGDVRGHQPRRPAPSLERRTEHERGARPRQGGLSAHLQTELSGRTHVPFRQTEKASQTFAGSLAVQACPSAITFGQVPPAVGQSPTKQRVAPAHAWPAPTQAIALQVRLDVSQPSPLTQSLSYWQGEPAGAGLWQMRFVWQMRG